MFFLLSKIGTEKMIWIDATGFDDDEGWEDVDEVWGSVGEVSNDKMPQQQSRKRRLQQTVFEHFLLQSSVLL